MFDLQKRPQSITEQTTVQLEQPHPSDPVQQLPDQDQQLLASQQQSVAQQQSYSSNQQQQHSSDQHHQPCPSDQKGDSPHSK